MMGCGNDSVKGVRHRNYDLRNADVIPGEIVIDLKDNVSDSDVAELSKIAGVRLHADNPTAEKFKIEHGHVDPNLEQEVLDRLASDPRVEHSEPAYLAHALFIPNDPMYKEQWGITRIGSESAWNMTCGRGSTIAMLDTGIATHLSDFAETKFLTGYNFADNNEDTNDRQSHGSHTAATVAESTSNNIGGAGIAYCATILPVKVLGDNGSGSLYNVAEGIRWAADQRANIINMSLGAHVKSDIIEDAVNYALDHGSVVVASNGNSGGSIGWPAAYPGVIAVSAIDNRDHIADFSSRGPETVISGPGVDILQITVGEGGKGEQYVKYSGTSMSAPGISGVGAMIVSMGVNKPDAVKAILQSSAEDIGLDSDEQGAGMVRADRAVRSIIFTHTLLRLLGLAGLLFFFRKQINTVLVKSKLSIIGIVLGGFGLVPLFFLHVMPHTGIVRVLVEMLARPIGEMNIPLGFLISYLPLANCIPATFASLLFLNSRLKNFAGGLALGSAALCAQMAYSNDMNFVFGSLVMRMFMVVSVVVCGYFVKTIFAQKL